VYYSLLGGLITLVLEALDVGAGRLSVYLQTRAAQAAMTSSIPFQSHKFEFGLVTLAVTLVVFLSQCAICFWIGRKTSPRWYWGLSPIAAKVARLLAFTLPSVLATPNNGGLPWIYAFVMDAAVVMLIIPEIMALAAILGSRSARRFQKG
jgi:hypothetical protein